MKKLFYLLFTLTLLQLGTIQGGMMTTTKQEEESQHEPIDCNEIEKLHRLGLENFIKNYNFNEEIFQDNMKFYNCTKEAMEQNEDTAKQCESLKEKYEQEKNDLENKLEEFNVAFVNLLEEQGCLKITSFLS